ncbi:conjugal transfer protein TrbE, partial [Klebsiella pneumoniae]|nr:conjugal transfer protein TrbE [Klebsiella pneumoniae]
FFWFVSYLFFSSLAALLRKKTEEE